MAIDWGDLADKLARGRKKKSTSTNQRIVLYVPDHTGDNPPRQITKVEHVTWIAEASRVLRRACNGSTSNPQATGEWYDDDNNTVITENTVLVYAFIFDVQKFEAHLDEIADFIHNFSTATNQGAFFLELGGEVREISFR